MPLSHSGGVKVCLYLKVVLVIFNVHGNVSAIF